MTGTRKSFKEFCSGSSTKAKSTRTNKSGYYSVRQEQFLTDKERGPDGEFGPEWGEIEFREEENYYFKLSQHKDWLLQYLDNRADAVIPDFRQTELRNAVEKTQRRSLHLASEIAARLGNRAAVRQRFRHLRLVRRPNELHQLRRLRSNVESDSFRTTLNRSNFPR